MLEHSLVHLGGYSWCLFPWLGTRSFRTLRKYIAANAKQFRISGIEFEGCCYMTFKMEGANDFDFIDSLCRTIDREGIDRDALAAMGDAPVFEKYDDFVPSELLRRAYATDKMNGEETAIRLLSLAEE
jgi:ATP-dependent Lhr-like helicase